MSKGPDFFSEKASFCAMWIGFVDRKKRLCNDQEASFHQVSGRGGWVETLRGQNVPGMTRGWGLNPQAACAKRPWDSLQHDQHWRSFCVWVWHLPQQTAKLVVPIVLSTAVPSELLGIFLRCTYMSEVTLVLVPL